MIAELQDVKPEDRHTVLNQMAASLLPDPGVSSSRATSIDERADRILSALRFRLGHKDRPSDNAKLFGLVADELSKRYLTENKVTEIRTRLNSRAELEPAQSNIVLGTDVLETMSLFALRKSDIFRTLHEPDVVQRVLPPELGIEEGRFLPMSFRLTRHRIESDDAYSILLHCVHEDDKITIFQAFRVYNSEVPLAVSGQPFEVFRALLEVYGSNLILNGVPQNRKLVYYEVISLHGQDYFDLGSDVPDGEPNTKVLFSRFSPLGFAEIVFAHVFKIQRYVRDLSRHGLPVNPSSIQYSPTHFRKYSQTFRANK